MKDLNIKENPQKTLHIPALTGGLDLRDLHDKSNNSLSNCKNVWQKGGILKSRPALFCDINSVLGKEEYYYNDPSATVVTDIEYEYGKTVYRMVYKSVEVDIATHFCYTNLIGPDGKVFKTARIIFTRTSSDTFYIPQKFNFFKGKPSTSSGTGIYLLIKLINCENSDEINSRIYELNSSLESWMEVYATYIPTVLINGRGNGYELARQADQAFGGNPKRLEGLNALTGDFYSYFSSDGYSSSFRLPLSSLSQSSVTARFYYSAENYVDWHISATSNQSTSTLFNNAVTMTVNRENGIVSFSCSTGEYFLPFISGRNENNLRILAKKESGYSLNDIADSDVCLNLNGKIFFGSKNRIFSSSFENPLYFPAESVSTLWGEDSRVTALVPLSENFLAFTKNRIYKGEVKDGKNLNTYSLLADNDSIFKAPHSVELECVNYNIGCAQKNSVITNGKEVFFLSNGEFYCFKQNEAKNISEKIKDFLPQILGEYSSVCALEYENCLLFFFQNKALCFDKKDAWYYWEFNQNIRFSGAFNTETRPILLVSSDNNPLHFTATLKGDIDTFFKGNITNPLPTEEAIPCLISTNEIAPECTSKPKSINCLSLSLEGKQTEISLGDTYKTKIKKAEFDNPVKLVSPITKTNRLYINLKGTAPLKLGSICIDYTLLSL